jgi:hypothetical protein
MFEIQPGWNMIFDLEESPLLKTLIINGKLSFLNDGSIDQVLKAKHIFVRTGQLHIGSKEQPYERQAKIILYGSEFDNGTTFEGTFVPGTKRLINTGEVKMYGMSRSRMTRLAVPAQKGDQTI